MNKVYFDNNSTTELAKEVLDTMVECSKMVYGNPSSLHTAGVEAEKVVKEARRTIAKCLNVDESELIFTSGATESINIALKGAARARKRFGRKILTTEVEHEAVLNTLKSLEQEGFEILTLPPDSYGRISPEQLLNAVCDETILVCLMQVNNELGTVYPINEIAKLSKRKNQNLLFFSDGAQGFCKIPTSLEDIDLYSVSGHKFHGPKATGALYIKKGVHLSPLLHGGNQENGFRPGTENVPGIAAFAKAVEISYLNLEKNQMHVKKLKDKFLEGILPIEGVRINSPDCAIAHTLNIAFPPIRGEILLHALEKEGIFVSTGAACSSKNRGASHVIEALKLSKEIAESSIRISFSRFNTEKEVEYALSVFKHLTTQLKETL